MFGSFKTRAQQNILSVICVDISCILYGSFDSHLIEQPLMIIFSICLIRFSLMYILFDFFYLFKTLILNASVTGVIVKLHLHNPK